VRATAASGPPAADLHRPTISPRRCGTIATPAARSRPLRPAPRCTRRAGRRTR